MRTREIKSVMKSEYSDRMAPDTKKTMIYPIFCAYLSAIAIRGTRQSANVLSCW